MFKLLYLISVLNRQPPSLTYVISLLIRAQITYRLCNVRAAEKNQKCDAEMQNKQSNVTRLSYTKTTYLIATTKCPLFPRHPTILFGIFLVTNTTVVLL